MKGHDLSLLTLRRQLVEFLGKHAHQKNVQHRFDLKAQNPDGKGQGQGHLRALTQHDRKGRPHRGCDPRFGRGRAADVDHSHKDRFQGRAHDHAGVKVSQKQSHQGADDNGPVQHGESRQFRSADTYKYGQRH